MDKKRTFLVSGMHCAGCAAAVERVMAKFPVREIYVNFASGRLNFCSIAPCRIKFAAGKKFERGNGGFLYCADFFHITADRLFCSYSGRSGDQLMVPVWFAHSGADCRERIFSARHSGAFPWRTQYGFSDLLRLIGRDNIQYCVDIQPSGGTPLF